tara:strand:+ start:324 stop:464 length:141 start_codon:yes stop_codon:yes gene_type:complete
MNTLRKSLWLVVFDGMKDTQYSSDRSLMDEDSHEYNFTVKVIVEEI